MSADNYVRGKDKNELLHDLYGTAQPGSVVHEQLKMGIMVRCTEDLENAFASLEASMSRNADASSMLARKVYWLNVILTAATIVGAFATVVAASASVWAAYHPK